MNDLTLSFGIAFADLYSRDGLVRVDRAFVADLAAADVGLHDRLMTARRDPDALAHAGESDLLVDLAPHVEDFLGNLFGITAEARALQARHQRLAPLYSVKRLFVQRRAVKGVSAENAAALDGPALAAELDALTGGPGGQHRGMGAGLRRARRPLARRRGRQCRRARCRATLCRLGHLVARRSRETPARCFV